MKANNSNYTITIINRAGTLKSSVDQTCICDLPGCQPSLIQTGTQNIVINSCLSNLMLTPYDPNSQVPGSINIFFKNGVVTEITNNTYRLDASVNSNGTEITIDYAF